MNENPGDTPNPLNQNNNPLDANPADGAPLEEIVEEVQAGGSATMAGPAPMTGAMPTAGSMPMSSTMPAAGASPASAPNDPLARPMEQAPTVEPVQPKKKTGLIIGIIIAAVLLIGGIATALVLVFMNQGDPVVKAAEKVMSGNMPANVAVDGTLTFEPSEETPPIENVQVKLASEASTSSMLNKAGATVIMNFTTGTTTEFTVGEIYASNGDLFFKVDNLTGALEDYAAALQNTMLGKFSDVNCEEDENGEMVCEEEALLGDTEDAALLDEAPELSTETAGALTGSLGIFEVIDGEWIRIPLDNLNELSDDTETDSSTACLVNLLSNSNNYKNSLAEAYNKNQFVSSTTEGVTLASKSGEPVRKVVFDKEKAQGFTGAIQNSNLAKDLKSCMGESSTTNTESSISSVEMPDFYVEVDKDFNFVRLFFETPMDVYGCANSSSCDQDTVTNSLNLTVDLSFSYPNTIDIAEPTEYRDLSDMLQEIMTSLYVTSSTGEAAVTE